MKESIESIIAERHRQDEKWGEQNHPDEHWLAILMEEVGEVAQVITERVVEPPIGEKPPTLDVLKAEVIQCAAVAVAWLESIDRREDV